MTLSRLLHRACAADIGRLATSAAEVGAALDGAQECVARITAVRSYMRGVLAAIVIQIRIEDDVLRPLLLHRAGPTAHNALTAAAVDHAVISPRLSAARDLADRLLDGAGGRHAAHRLAATLDDLDLLVRARCADHQLRISPLIVRCLTVGDHAWMQHQFHRSVPDDLLGFMAPWLVSHATAAEFDALLDDANKHIRPVQRIFGQRFEALRALAFDRAGSPTPARSRRRVQ